MPFTDGYPLSQADVELAAIAARAAYDGEVLPSGWSVVTPQALGLSAEYQNGNYFQGGALNSASAIVLMSGGSYIVSFRGTDSYRDFLTYPLLLGNNYISLFDPLLIALKDVGTAGSNFLFTGHSLGGGAANQLANIASDEYDGFFAGSRYVAFASPLNYSVQQILNVGFENDIVFEIGDVVASGEPSATDHLINFTDEFDDLVSLPLDYAHSRDYYVDAVQRIGASEFAPAITSDSWIIIDNFSGLLDATLVDTGGEVLFILGSTSSDQVLDTATIDQIDSGDGDDVIFITTGDDVVVGGVGDDTIYLQSLSRADAIVSTNGGATVIESQNGRKTISGVETIIYTGLSDVSTNDLLAFGSNTLFRNDDGSSDFISLVSIFEDGLSFNGQNFSGLYVNTNGNVTFDGPLSQYTPGVIGNGLLSIIAPFWADLDTRLPDAGVNGNVHWDFNTARDSFIVTWNDVGYFDRQVDKTNTFQLELVDQGGGNFEIIFRYENIDWTTGDASGGVSGLGGTVARSGFSSGNGLTEELPGSGSQSSVLALDTREGNTGVVGVWQFQVTNGDLQGFGTGGIDTYRGDDGPGFYFAGAGNDRLFGNGGNDRLYGEDGDDYLVGGPGDDYVDGGPGRDMLIAGSGLGNDEYDGGSGIDLIIFSSATRPVVINLTTGVATGVQTGSDSLINIENVSGGAGADRITGNRFVNSLSGLGGNDTISGLAGNDVLVGGLGRDFLTGGTGLDDFDFNSITETGKTAATRDVILDFRHLQDDIDLSTIDANGTAAGNAAFKFLAANGAAFTGVRGQLHWFQSNPAGTARDKTIIEGDINGDRKADFQIELIGLKVLTAADFVL